METQQLWYSRRGNEVRGPFPARQISRFILLGRIRETDELSVDQQHWQQVSELPVLIPEEMRLDAEDPEAHERLMIARMREDERAARDRRGDDEVTGPDVPRDRRRSDDDRRTWEESEMLRHREIKTAIADAAKHSKQNYFLRGVVAALLFSGMVGSAFFYHPWDVQESSDCNSIPQPWVNWNNCFMEGVQLAAFDLRGARLRNSNLTGSDLRGTILTGADLAYATLTMANMSDAVVLQGSLVGATLRRATLKDADFTDANLSYAILENADLSNAIFQNADLRNADLRGANISGADFSKALLGNVQWTDGRRCLAESVGSCEH